jgi:RNase P subunit RPR2
MQNVIRPKITMSEEEIEKIKNMDWDSYYKESLPSDMQGMITCSKCRSILVAREGQSEISCYKCGEKNRL